MKLKMLFIAMLVLCSFGSVSADEEQGFNAVVLCCSEPLPDINTLFPEFKSIAVVRSMGNVISLAGLMQDSVELGSIEYAVKEQGATQVIVLGHKGCGVMRSVIGNSARRDNFRGVSQVLCIASTSAGKVFGKDKPEELLQRAVEDNVRNMMYRLERDNDGLSALIKAGLLEIVGAVYDPQTGKAEPLTDKTR